MSTPQLARLTPDATADEAVDIIMRDGGVIVEGLFDQATIDGLMGDLGPVLKAVDTGHDEVFAGNRTRRAGGLFGRTKHMTTIAMDPLYRGIAEAILDKPIEVWFGPERAPIAPGFHVGVTQAIQIGPGQGSQPLHRDDTVWMWRHPNYGREARVQIMVAASDFTAENGGTLVIPGSHLWDDERQPKREEAISTEMKAGSALIWIGSTYHGGGQNESDTYRTGVTMAYDLAFLRTEENHFLSLSLDTVRGLPETLQRALGWGSGESFIGYVEVAGQMADPHQLLSNEEYTSIDAGLPASL